MKLRGINFGHVLDASGARGWFGEGYSFHRFARSFGLNFQGSTFVAKTTTLDGRDPNGVLRTDGVTPRVVRQNCVKVKWSKGVVLNALGLPGPGFASLLNQGCWQQRREPFFLSFMAIKESPEDSFNEVRAFVQLLRDQSPRFSTQVGLQVNFSCPNVMPRNHLREFSAHLDEYQKLDIPIMVKLSATTPVESALTIAGHHGCDALCVSNSIAWGEFRKQIDWNGLWGSESPLREYGGGGLSGAPLLPIVAEWVKEARRQGLRKPINAGGGILQPTDVDVLLAAGASSVFVGSIAILRPWRLQKTIRHANALYARVDAQEKELVSLPKLRRA